MNYKLGSFVTCVLASVFCVDVSAHKFESTHKSCQEIDIAKYDSNIDGLLTDVYNLKSRDKGDKYCISILQTPKSENSKIASVNTFLEKRSVVHAENVLATADSPRSIALGYRCLAEAYFAIGERPKAILFSFLSTAYHPTHEAQKQLLGYLPADAQGLFDKNIDRSYLLERLAKLMHKAFLPETFRTYFDLAAAVGLVSSYPYTPEMLEEEWSEPLHLIVGFDDNYVYHGSVTMLSAMLSADPKTRYVFHIPETPDSRFPITDGHKKQLEALTRLFPKGKYRVVFDKYHRGTLPKELHNRTYTHWPSTILYKMYIPQFYSDFDRVMWLDSDLIVRSDLTEFYTMDMEGNWIAAVRDIKAISHLARLGLNIEDAYFNAGVMVFDNAALKPNMHRVAQTVAEYGGRDDYVLYPEQDLLSLAFKDHIKEVSFQRRIDKRYHFELAKWNWFYIRRHPSVAWDKVHAHYSKIIHMASRVNKPWNRRSSPLQWAFYPKGNDGVQNLYWALRDMGPWPSQN